MKVCNYEDEEIIKNEKSIFLAGPTPRTHETLSWRPRAIEILRDLGYDGAIYSPESINGPINCNNDEFPKIVEWELKHLKNATVIVFWIPRELKFMPAFTTNVEFGFHLNYNTVYGRPDNSVKNRYLDYLYTRETGKTPFKTLNDTLKEAVNLSNKLNNQEIEFSNFYPYADVKSKIFFTSDTHFDSMRTLAYSFRPFKNVEEMNFNLIKKWNSIVSKQDTVYHLGDFGCYDYIKKLNGKVVLILGNYELKDLKEKFNNNKKKFKEYLINLGFYDVLFDKNNKLNIKSCITNENITINMSHKPLDCKSSCFNLFGHIHEKCRVKQFGLNVGVDVSYFSPISVEEVLFLKNAITNNYDNDVFCSLNDIYKL